jgi:cytochrome c oxidase subunit II
MALPRRRHILPLALLTAVVASLVIAPSAMAEWWRPEGGGSPNADRINDLYMVAFIIGAIIFLGVEGLLIYCLVKFRARKGAVAAQIRGNTRLEIGWTIGAALILVVLAVFTFVALPGIRDPDNSDASAAAGIVRPVAAHGNKKVPPSGKALNIEVNGQQYIWRFTYPDGDDNPLNNAYSYEEMVVPVGVTVTLDIRAQDVAHSWWIPALGGKMDAIPGYTNYTWFKVLKPGVYTGQCAELCGRGHANMIAQVRAVSPDEYKAFIARRTAALKAADEAAAVARKKLDADPQATP